jgi:hypothetical protein
VGQPMATTEDGRDGTSPVHTGECVGKDWVLVDCPERTEKAAGSDARPVVPIKEVVSRDRHQIP